MKTYEVYWQELVTHMATVHADSADEAIALFKDGEYDDLYLGEASEYFGEYPASVEEQ